MLQESQLISLLNRLLNQDGKLRKGDTEITYRCFNGCKPEKSKLEICIDSSSPNFGNFHCWICQTKGRSFRSLLNKLKAKESYFEELYKIIGKSWKPIESDKKEEEIRSLPDEFIPLWTRSKISDYGIAMDYLYQRGILMDDIIRYGIGFCTEGQYRQRVIIPSYDNDGNINFFAARAFYGGNPYKYMLPPWSKNIIGFELFINWEYEWGVTLTEGPFDVMTIRNNAIPLFGTTMSNKLKEKIILSGIPRVNIVLDNDRAGFDGAIKIYEFLQPFNIDVHLIRLEDKDASVMGFKAVSRLIEDSRPFEFSDIIRMKLEVL